MRRFSSRLSASFILLFIISLPGHASDLGKDGNAPPQNFVTQSGPQFFVANEGFISGANYQKVFGPNRPTTLWDDNRRADCYEFVLRQMAQLPFFDELENPKAAQELLRDLGLAEDAVERAANALGALKTNYVTANTLTSTLGNQFSQALRGLNPKSKDGISIPCTNLKALGEAMDKFQLAGKIYDFAIGAALQEALAGDLALGRLTRLEKIFRDRENGGFAVDPAILTAISRAEKNLVRSEDYWGALMTELQDRRQELVAMGLKYGVRMIQKDAVGLLTRFYKGLGLGSKAAATKAASVAGLWAFSAVATYETIAALLEQHEGAQISVTSATLAYLIQEELQANRIPDDNLIKAFRGQAEYAYYDQMVKISSGFLPAYHDIFSKGHPYKDVRLHFTALRQQALEEAKKGSSTLVSSAQQASTTGRSILILLDTSGSMTERLPRSGEMKITAAKRILHKLLKETTGATEWALVVFKGCQPKILVEFTTEKSRIGEALESVRPDEMTPLAAALLYSRDYLARQGRFADGAVVVLSDGKDTCGGDPIKAARDVFGQPMEFRQWQTR